MPAEIIDIPEEAKRSKPHYLTFKAASAVKAEILEWIRSGHMPYLWRDHTHTRPPEGDNIAYVGEFDLPGNDLSPCPCCTPRHAKFRSGKTAWFQDEHVIRLIGPDCFRTLNPEGHDVAIVELRRRQAHEREVQWVRDNPNLKIELIGALNAMRSVAEELDSMALVFGPALKRECQIDLWRYIRDEGKLFVHILTSVPYRISDGSIESRQEDVQDLYSRISGFGLVNPDRRPAASRCLKLLAELAELYMPVGQEESVAVEELQRTASTFRRVRQSTISLIDEINDHRTFLSQKSIATLRNWAEQVGAPVRLFVQRGNGKLRLGESEEEARELPLDPCVDIAISAIT